MKQITLSDMDLLRIQFLLPQGQCYNLHTNKQALRKAANISAETNISDLELRKICRETALVFFIFFLFEKTAEF